MANGTAVNVVTMVFGNLGNDSRHRRGLHPQPGTGENTAVRRVPGQRPGRGRGGGHPHPQADRRPRQTRCRRCPASSSSCATDWRATTSEVQDFEFTIERGMLYCLQTRNGKMNAIAHGAHLGGDGHEEGLITQGAGPAARRPGAAWSRCCSRASTRRHKATPRRHGPAGLARRRLRHRGVRRRPRRDARQEQGRKVILVREETKPEDIHGFFASAGHPDHPRRQDLARGGGGARHGQALRGRCRGHPRRRGPRARASSATPGVKEGDVITIDGTTGKVYLGEIPTVEPEFSDELVTLLGWADEVARLKVMANADTPDDAARALKYGADGHRPVPHRAHVQRRRAPADRHRDDRRRHPGGARRPRSIELLPMQREDFPGMFKVMSPHPVTIRLLDPPIHEFLPTERQLEREHRPSCSDLRRARPRHDGAGRGHDAHATAPDNVPRRRSTTCAEQLDPMLVEWPSQEGGDAAQGARAVRDQPHARPSRRAPRHHLPRDLHRCRSGPSWRPRRSASRPASRSIPRSRCPRSVPPQELKLVKTWVDDIQSEIEATVRRAGELQVRHHDRGGAGLHARRDPGRGVAEFFSFGTNDLTQATFSFSREDAENKFLPLYNQSRHPAGQPLRGAGREGRGQADAAGGGVGPHRSSRTCRSASAASTAATRPPSPSATRSGSTMCPARLRACRSPGWPPPTRPLPGQWWPTRLPEGEGPSPCPPRQGGRGCPKGGRGCPKGG